jgi:hypothetical protein
MSLVRAARLAVLATLALPGAAHADATVAVTGTAPGKVLTFTVADGLDHTTDVATDDSGHLILSDGGIAGGAGCTSVSAVSVDCGPAADLRGRSARRRLRSGAAAPHRRAGHLGRGDRGGHVDPLDPAQQRRPGRRGLHDLGALRCSGLACTDVDGAEDGSYTLTDADAGHRIGVVYWAANGAGWDGAASATTDIVAGAAVPAPAPPAAAPVRPTVPQPPAMTPLPARFVVAGAPKVVLRGSTATVDTGRRIACLAGQACRLTVSARAGGRVVGTAKVTVAAGKTAKVTVRLTARTVRQLRRRHKLTLTVKAVLMRGTVQHATTPFAVTIKAPARRPH